MARHGSLSPNVLNFLSTVQTPVWIRDPDLRHPGSAFSQKTPIHTDPNPQRLVDILMKGFFS